MLVLSYLLISRIIPPQNIDFRLEMEYSEYVVSSR